MGTPVLNHVVDTSATFELKLAALRAHASQVGGSRELEQRIRKMDAERAARYGMAFAEEFHRAENT
jgi:LmbE family N-acetylglucosaminyl deacetylase